MLKDDFPLYNTNQKIKLVAKNKEPEQKHAQLIYCILFTWKRNKQLSDYLLLLIQYFVFWHMQLYQYTIKQYCRGTCHEKLDADWMK